jgi:glycosyltransferase involved in cell wall biosynthesis
MTFGAPRAVTAPGWPLVRTAQVTREEVRRCLGISAEAIVVGIVGSLDWNEPRQYCYGWELAKCAGQLDDPRFVFLIVGEGSGLERLRREAAKLPAGRVVLPGVVALEEVMGVLSAMDVGSLPQSMDGVGLFRYTTKLSEYAAAGLPVITSQIPVAYDLGHEWMWRLPGAGPWTDEYIGAMTSLLRMITPQQIEERRGKVPRQLEAFEREAQVARVTSFIRDILEAGRRSAL